MVDLRRPALRIYGATDRCCGRDSRSGLVAGWYENKKTRAVRVARKGEPPTARRQWVELGQTIGLRTMKLELAMGLNWSSNKQQNRRAGDVAVGSAGFGLNWIGLIWSGLVWFD